MSLKMVNVYKIVVTVICKNINIKKYSYTIKTENIKLLFIINLFSLYIIVYILVIIHGAYFVHLPYNCLGPFSVE